MFLALNPTDKDMRKETIERNLIMMLSQKELAYQVITTLRSSGKSDLEITITGPALLLESFKRGEWRKEKGTSTDQDVLKYSRELLKNWMKKDTRLNGGNKYIPMSRISQNIPTLTELIELPAPSESLLELLDKIS